MLDGTASLNIILLQPEELFEGTFSFLKTDGRFLHIKKVLKLCTGSRFKAGIINGKKGTAEITAFSEERLTAQFTASAETAGSHEAYMLPHIRLILGFPRPIQLRRILRDVAGLGIEALYLIGTDLGEKSYLQADIAAEPEIERLLIDGCSQAGETHIPHVYRAHSLRCFFDRYEEAIQTDSLRAVLDVPFYTEQTGGLPISAAYPLTRLKWGGKETLWLAIGNERGWSAQERTRFAKKQFTTYSMGQRILRTETAVAAAVAVCLAQSGAWDSEGSA